MSVATVLIHEIRNLQCDRACPNVYVKISTGLLKSCKSATARNAGSTVPFEESVSCRWSRKRNIRFELYHEERGRPDHRFGQALIMPEKLIAGFWAGEIALMDKSKETATIRVTIKVD